MHGDILRWVPPSTLRGKVKVSNFEFWCNFLYNRLLSVYKWELPDSWDEDYLQYYLFRWGYLPVIPTPFGGLALEGTLNGRNPYNKPNMVKVQNRGESWDIDFEGIIGKNCEVLAPFNDYTPKFNEIIAEYGYTLAMLTASLNMSILNSRLAYVFAAKDKASAKTIEDIMGKVYNGQPAVTYDKLLGRPDDHSDSENWNFVQLNPSSAYLSDRLIADRESIIREFDMIIGLPTVNNKKERMISSEVDIQNSGSTSMAKRVLRNLEEQVTRINAMFNLNIKVSLAQGGERNASFNDDYVRVEDSK